MLLDVLLRLGIVKRNPAGRVVWPVNVMPYRWWKFLLTKGDGGMFPRFGVFRNRPGVVKWLPGRALPRRWGFFVLGLEIGDRG